MSPQQLIDFRTKFSLSDKGLANLLGVTFQGVRLWESGQRAIPTTTVKILNLLNRNPHLMQEF